MADYQKMYFQLFNSITDSIEHLVTAQQDTEDFYIASQDEKIILANQSNPDSKNENR